MIILKVFNNNSVVALSDDRQDVIVTGAGVGFHKKPGDRIDEHRIEKDFSSEIFIAISDHISYAMKRKSEGIYLPNIILNETKVLYKEEYEIGLMALSILKAHRLQT